MPQQLVAAGEEWHAEAKSLQSLADALRMGAAKLPGCWEGTASERFGRTMGDVVAAIDGREQPHRAPDTGRLDFSSLADAVGDACASAGWAILRCLIWAPLHGIGRAFHGRAWHGGWHSTAGAVLAGVLAGARDEDFDNTECVLAFTSTRLLVLDLPTVREEFAPYLLAEVPRRTFALRAESHPARQKDRVDVVFRDGSWLALSLPKSDVPAVERLLQEQ